MRRVLAAIVGLGIVGGSALAQDETEVPECVEVRGEARYQGLGYSHVVIVDNGCDRRARCEVWTDVAPERLAVTVQAGQEREVVTRQGSPAYEFRPYASCELTD